MKNRLISPTQCGKIRSKVKTVDIKKEKLLSTYKNRHPEMRAIAFPYRTMGEEFLTITAANAERLNRVSFQLSL